MQAQTTTSTTSTHFPADTGEAARWVFSRRVRKLLYSDWDDLLADEVLARIGRTRAKAWGKADTAHNLLRSVADTLTSNYVRPPHLGHADEPAADFLEQRIRAAALWPLMGRHERDLHGLREMGMRVDINPRTGKLLFRSVFPDVLVQEADDWAPDRPRVVRELRWRRQVGAWCYDVLSIDGTPEYRVVKADGAGDDLTQEVLGRPPMVGDAYPYRDATGEPVLPFVLYHAAKTGRLYDYRAWADLFQGTLTLGVFYTQVGHILDNAAHPQRVAVGLQPAGLQAEDNGKRQGVVTDPAVLLLMEVMKGFDGQPILHQFEPGGDPVKIMDVIARYERALVSTAGVPASDVARVSGDPRSGYAIMLSRAGQREMQRRIQPQLLEGDTEVLRLAAILTNRWSEQVGKPVGLPESGYSVTYAGIPPTADEQTAERAHLLELLDKGLISPVEVYRRLNPGTSAEAALADLQAIAALRRTLDPRHAPAPGDTHAH